MRGRAIAGAVGALVLFTATARASNQSPCLLNFATFRASSEEEGRALVVSTYLQLLDALGTKLSPETLDKLIDSREPFAIPERTENADAFRQKVGQLEKMARQKGWVTDATKQFVVTALAERRDRMRDGVEKQNVVVEDTVKDYQIKNDSAMAYQLTPDGHLILSKNSSQVERPPGPWKEFMHIHDLRTGKSHHLESPRDFTHDLLLTRDGKGFLYSSGKGQISRLPFHDGKIDWNGEQTFAPGNVSGDEAWVRDFREGADPHIVYARVSLAASPTTYRYNLKTNERLRLTLDGQPFRATGADAWGTVEGTNNLFVLFKSSGGVTLNTYSVDSSGKMIKLPDSRSFSAPGANEVKWIGDTAVVYRRHEPTLWVARANGSSTNLMPLMEAGGGKGNIFDALVHPTTGELLVLTQREHDKFTINRFDGKTFSHLGYSDLQPGHHVLMSATPDGKRLIFAGGSYDINIVNWSNRH